MKNTGLSDMRQTIYLVWVSTALPSYNSVCKSNVKCMNCKCPFLNVSMMIFQDPVIWRNMYSGFKFFRQKNTEFKICNLVVPCRFIVQLLPFQFFQLVENFDLCSRIFTVMTFHIFATKMWWNLPSFFVVWNKIWRFRQLLVTFS